MPSLDDLSNGLKDMRKRREKILNGKGKNENENKNEHQIFPKYHITPIKLSSVDVDDIIENSKRLKQGCTSLMYACQQGNIKDVVKELRTKPKKVYQRDRTNKNVLHYCSGQSDNLVAVASVAVAAPELLESADEDGFTPLHLAVIQGNLAMVNLLLANKADVNVVDNEGHSVVHWATVCGEVEPLRAVLQAGANVKTPDVNGGTPLHYAAQMCGANYEGKLSQASSKLAMEILQILLSHPQSSVDVIDKDGRQPLLWAASAGSAKAVIALVKAGARVESSDKDGLTALHCAASRGHTECIDTLISLCGAPTDLIDSNGCTALHYAVTLGHADATARLLDLEADPNRQDRKGRTPAHCGCAKGQLETVKLVRERGANLWLRNAKGDLPIHEATGSGRRELVEWLLDQRPKQVNTTSNDGRTMLHIAASNDYTDMCKMLIDFGADVNSIYRNSKGVAMTPLDCALQKGLRSTAKFLQSNGGLPASKLRLSSRPSAFNDHNFVKPLKYIEKEELHDLKNEKKYVAYRNSDTESTECSCTENVVKKERRSNHMCRHHRKKFRRRTGSCGEHEHICCNKYNDGRRSVAETKTVDREDLNDMSRSKSNIEIRRKRSKDPYFSSSEEDENDSCEVCCKHKRRLKGRKHEKYNKKDSKEYLQKEVDKSVLADKKNELEEFVITAEQEFKSERKQRPQSAKRRQQRKEGTFIKSPPTEIADPILPAEIIRDVLPVENTNKILRAENATVDLTDEEEVQKSEVVVTQVQIHKEEESAISNEKAEIIQEPVEKISEASTDEISKEIEEVLKNATEQVENLVLPPVTNVISPTPPTPSSISTQEGGDKMLEELKADTDAPGPLSITEDDNKTVSVEEKKKEKEEYVGKLDDSALGKETENNIDEKQSELVKEPKIDEVVDTEKSIGKKDDQKVERAEEIVKLDGIIEDAKVDIKHIQSDREQESRKSFTLLPDSPAGYEVGEERKSSFTVLKSDESIELDDGLAITDPSFQIVSEKAINYSSEADEHAEVDEEGVSPNQYDVSDVMYQHTGRHSALAGSPSEFSASGRRKRLKRRVKSGGKSRPYWRKASDDESHQQASKDQDSGFEPSPRGTKTKITTDDRTVYTAYMPRKTIYATLDGRSCSSRAENRKPGDKNACNMTAVSKSIHRNVRRYYMERKIFQHLLELKSLQIRSNKVNESVLVKRAVDDYHKSCIALGAETGGTLRRYPYTEYTFKNFEMFLYETLKSLQKPGTYNFQNINEVYEEAERRLSPDYNMYEKALRCTTKTHRCFHAAHAYTGIPCAAYIPMMNHHTMPKNGFTQYKKCNSFYLPKIINSPTKGTSSGAGHSTSQLPTTSGGTKVSLELTHGKNKQLISLPSEKLDSNKRYYVTFTVKGSGEGVVRQTGSAGDGTTTTKIELNDGKILQSTDITSEVPDRK